jgi:ATP-dependent helicase HepA
MTFIIGQRWISNTESQLGLGIITNTSHRQVTLNFPAANEERTYATNNPPLSRIICKEGEELITNELKTITITHVEEYNGLLFYSGIDESGETHTIIEGSMHCSIKLSTPEQRLFNGLLDKLNSFKLRIDTLNHISRLQQSKVLGLLGSRTHHLPHQIYIAQEVAQRYAPRVLLADEVGLGKTIEAGMILHYQLHTGRAQRVLICVPNTLIHQWLVEMRRRFNLYFSIIDQNRYDDDQRDALDDDNAHELSPASINNLFESEQLVLCSIDFLMNNEQAHKHATSANWDLLVVDEAHHLYWSEETKSPEYTCIEQLSAESQGLLLLTATPEQVGIESHFARLRLLDSARFYDFEQFKKEELQYQAINQMVQNLINHQQTSQGSDISPALKEKLQMHFGEQIPSNSNDAIKMLLDRHGTGRVLFRNTRAAIQGFPPRHLHKYPLTKTPFYNALIEQNEIIDLYPEQRLDKEQWITHDPRVQWLASKIIELQPHKVLVICAEAKTAIALEQYLKLKAHIRSSTFHEGLSIIERDRAAAYFSEQELGAQALICSEIGSEGRNFQFSNHLILFDLPLNPDLLEQRIGRLDRIGQMHAIQIHVPYLVDTAQETLFRWYHEGINLFEQSGLVGCSIYEAFEEELLANLMDTNEDQLNELIIKTKKHTEKLKLTLHEGRDQLLEINSCNKPLAEELIHTIETEENNQELANYMAKVFHEYGVDHEHHSDQAEILRPTAHMKAGYFPGLKDDGITITYSRSKALIREDMEFLSWEHPMVHESMELILSTELGNTSLTTISVKNIMPGTLFLETFYTINCAAPKELQLDRFVPFNPLRLLIDLSGKNLSKILNYEQLNMMCKQVQAHISNAIIKQIRTDIETILAQSNKIAETQMFDTIETAKLNMKNTITQEINRLLALQKVNPSIRNDEINHLKQQLIRSEQFIGNATLQLQALRVVINN